MKRQTIFIILMFVFILTISGAVSATEKVSVNSTGGNVTNGDSYGPSISADGRYVAFESYATNLVSGDTNSLSDIFVKDTKTKTVERVSLKKDGNQITDSGSSYPVISANGRYVAYISTGDLGWGSGTSQIYLYDRIAKSTELVSQSSKLIVGNTDSYSPSISADGRYVAFYSDANNLMDPNFETSASDSNGVSDIFVRDRVAGTTKRVNLNNGIQATGGSSSNPSISADGRYVAFCSYATNLVSGDTNGLLDVFVRDTWGGTTKRVMGKTSSGSPAEPNGDSYDPSISSDGHYVSFVSYATNLVLGDTNGWGDVFRADMFQSRMPFVTLVSIAANGTQGNDWASSPSLSADGRYVSFVSWASNLVSGDTNGYNDVFVKDMVTKKIKRLSVSSNGTVGNSFSYDTAISANGKYVVFVSQANNLVSGDTNGKTDIFVNTVDFTSPVVKAVDPKKGATGVKRSKTITVTFSENIKIANASKIILKNSKGKVIATGKTVSGNKLILTHGKLAASTKYYIYINAGAIADYTDNPNFTTVNYKYYFKTGKH
jgi:Tol biopolymer transport system component